MLKYHSDMGHCFSLVLVVSKKVKKSTFLYWENRHGIGEKWIFSIWNGAEIRPHEKGRKSPVNILNIII